MTKLCHDCPHLKIEERTDLHPPARSYSCEHPKTPTETIDSTYPWIGFVAVTPEWCQLEQRR